MEDKIRTLEIDIETYSDVNLGDCGVYKYAESPNFEILLFGYSMSGSPVQVIDLACGEEMPERIKEAIQSKDVIKIAHNASFERICLSRYLGLPTGEYLDPASWRCSMVMSAYNGLPLSLKGVGSALGLDKQKLEEGKDLIRYFCVPCKPTKTNGERTRNLPEHAPHLLSGRCGNHGSEDRNTALPADLEGVFQMGFPGMMQRADDHSPLAP